MIFQGKAAIGEVEVSPLAKVGHFTEYDRSCRLFRTDSLLEGDQSSQGVQRERR